MQTGRRVAGETHGGHPSVDYWGQGGTLLNVTAKESLEAWGVVSEVKREEKLFQAERAAWKSLDLDTHTHTSPSTVWTQSSSV